MNRPLLIAWQSFVFRNPVFVACSLEGYQFFGFIAFRDVLHFPMISFPVKAIAARSKKWEGTFHAEDTGHYSMDHAELIRYLEERAGR